MDYKTVFQATMNGPIINMRREEAGYILKQGENVLEGATDVPATDKYSIWNGTGIVEDTNKQQADIAVARQMTNDINTALPGWEENQAAFDKLVEAVTEVKDIDGMKQVVSALILAMEVQVKGFNSVVTLMRKIWA